MQNDIKISQKEKDLTVEFIRSVLLYKDGNLYRNTDVYRQIKKGELAGTKMKSGYHTISINDKRYLSHRIIFFYHHGYFPQFIDHKDLDKSNNKIENLRAATFCQNNANKKAIDGLTSKYKGVCYCKNRTSPKKWCGIINSNNFKKRAYFENEIDAALFYNHYAKIAYGEFANLNVIISV